jgi:RNA polymerase sigma factor (sigma-70 family)
MGRPIDRRAVDQLVVEHLPTAWRFARRLTGDDHAAEDLVQEALCRVLRQWQTFRGEAAFRTWLLSIVVNVDRDRRRRLRLAEPIGPEHEPPTRAASPPELAVAEELHQDLQRAIDRLPERQREVALLIWGEGLGAADVAAVLGITESSVYTNIHLARQRVAAAIGVDSAGRRTI